MSDEISEHDKYVSKLNWLVRNGREDLIDEIADQFERSEPTGREVFWNALEPGWPFRRSA
jgi:hypothetical protein